MTDCWVTVDGTRFADTAADYYAGTPTALADVEVAWGRATTIDQPEAATARLTVLDRSGGSRFVEALPVGVPIEVWSSGDIGTGEPIDVAVDGSFESLPLGPIVPPNARVLTNTGDPSVTSTTAFAGTKAIAWPATPDQYSLWLSIPAASFQTDNPTAWDDVPKLRTSAWWPWQLAIRAPRGAVVTAQLYGVTSPTSALGQPAGIPVAVPADAAWHLISDPGATVPAPADGLWPAVQVNATKIVRWTSAVGTWQDTPGTWAEYGPPIYVDALELVAPPSGLVRDVLVFSGRITDLSATIDPDGTARVDVTAIDQLADLANRNVGDEPWTLEPLSTRANRIVNLSGAAVDLLIDEPLGALNVTRRDVDSQPAAGLLQELAAGVDGVLWSATHATTGPFLWLENPARRATLAVLAMVNGVVVIQPDTSTNAPAGRTAISGVWLPQGEVTWTRDVTDMLTRVDLTWQEQTTPDLTERNVRVADTAAEASGTVLRASVTTPLTTAPDAMNVGTRILNRSRKASWRTEGLTWDLGLIPPAPGEDTAAALDVLDGTRRIGRGIVVTDVDEWPGGSASSYLDGGRYRYDDAGWVLQFVTTPYTGVAASGPWTSLDPAWRWNQMDPAIGWADLFGVTGPVAA